MHGTMLMSRAFSRQLLEARGRTGDDVLNILLGAGFFERTSIGCFVLPVSQAAFDFSNALTRSELSSP